MLLLPFALMFFFCSSPSDLSDLSDKSDPSDNSDKPQQLK